MAAFNDYVEIRRRGIRMLIKTCTKCGNIFSYKDRFFSFTPKYRSVTCGACGAKFKISEFSRILLAFLITLPIIVKIIVPHIFYSRSASIIYAICSLLYIALLVLVAPFLIALKLESDETNTHGK
jgi:CXXC-20-CXXC protein